MVPATIGLQGKPGLNCMMADSSVLQRLAPICPLDQWAVVQSRFARLCGSAGKRETMFIRT